jgi:hypothetical protein
MEKMNLTSYIILHTEVISRWLIYPNVKVKTIKLLEESIEVYIHDLGERNRDDRKSTKYKTNY